MNSEFALAVHSLVLLAHSSEEKLTSTAIAENLSVHPVRIRKTLSILKKGGYIISKEGIKGGFSIKGSPKIITLGEVFNLTSNTALKPKCHECSGTCQIGKNIPLVLDSIFQGAHDELIEYLNKFTIDDIVRKLK